MLEREFQNKRKVRNRIYSKTTIFILFIVLVIFARATWGVYKTKVESKRSFDKISAEIQSLHEKEIALNAEVKRLNTEKGTEEEIRKKFNVIRGGEEVVFVLDPKEKEEDMVEESGFWKDILEDVTGFFH